ncbi:DUF536 domain-containing protein [Enterococcus faecium]|nr:DUF536 domain-containing protein [Enterococcus faecium]EMF0418841.1 DUF536 domain-containing protein [Enterococcus faecium]
MTDKTIKELAEEFHVSKQAIRKRLSADFRENYVQTVTRNGVKTLVVSYKGYLLLKQHFLGSNTTGNQVETVASNDENLIIDFLHEQLQEKDTQIKQMQKLLDQQQQLTLQANQQIEKLQEQLQLAYTEETPEDESTTILSEETESIEKHTKKKQKWWQLWK